MHTVATIIDALGGSIKLAQAIGRPIGTVSAWKTRGSIPPEHWRDLVEVAKQRGSSAITIDALLDVHTPSRVASSAHPAAHPSVA